MTNNESSAVAYGRNEQTRVCTRPECQNTFTAKPRKIYCSDKCRVKASDARKIERVRACLINHNLTDDDILKYSKTLLQMLTKSKPKRPFRMGPSHRALLSYIDAADYYCYAETIDAALVEEITPLSWGRRARELREQGILESYKIGRYTAFRRTQSI